MTTRLEDPGFPLGWHHHPAWRHWGWIVAALLPAVVVTLIASHLFLYAAGAAVLMVFLVWSIASLRMGIIVTVILASFVSYEGGRLTMELGVICGWLLWLALLLIFRSTWAGWKRPPSGLATEIGVWMAVCVMGVVVGLVSNGDRRFLALEFLAAAWPLLTIVVLQVFDRTHLAYALTGLVILGLLNTGFGIFRFLVEGQRVGGVAFTSLPGMVAIGLWTAALLTDRHSRRVLFLLLMVPLLIHQLLSFTRGYWLAGIIGLGVATALAWWTQGRVAKVGRRRIVAIAAAASIVAVLIGSVLISAFGEESLFESVSKRFMSSFSTEVTQETASNFFRLIEYTEAVRSASESPVIGRGFGHTIVMVDPFLKTRNRQWYVHNYYILTLLKLGILGILAFGFLLFRFLVRALRLARSDPSWQVRAWAIACFALVTHLLVMCLAHFPLAEVNTAFFFAFAWGVLFSLDLPGGRRSASPHDVRPPAQ